MKKALLLLGMLVPVAVGGLVNLLLPVPGLGAVCFTLLPLATTVFWFFLGRQYARAPWRGPLAIVIGNAAGIVSLLLYLWQFLGKTDETRNTIVAVVSQLFSASIPSYLTGKAALLFPSSPNYVGSEAKVALQVIALVYMLVVFTCGYAWGRRKQAGHGTERSQHTE